MKTCPNCHTQKDYSEFYRNCTTKDGYCSHCKQCKNECNAKREAKRNIEHHCLCCGITMMVNKRAYGQIGRSWTGLCRNCGAQHKNMYRPLGYAAMNSVYCRYRANAKRNGITFKITLDKFKEISQQDCHYCGRKPSNFARDKGNGSFTYTGVDRKDNDHSVGYIDENCLPCCKPCNLAKKDMPYQDYIDMIKRSYEHLKSVGIL